MDEMVCPLTVLHANQYTGLDPGDQATSKNGKYESLHSPATEALSTRWRTAFILVGSIVVDYRQGQVVTRSKDRLPRRDFIRSISDTQPQQVGRSDCPRGRQTNCCLCLPVYE